MIQPAADVHGRFAPDATDAPDDEHGFEILRCGYIRTHDGPVTRPL